MKIRKQPRPPYLSQDPLAKEIDSWKAGHSDSLTPGFPGDAALGAVMIRIGLGGILKVLIMRNPSEL